MIQDVTSLFPADWRMTVTVKRGGGFDRWGNPLPAVTHEIADCLIGEASSEELEQFSDVSSLDGVLYAPVAADVVNTDSLDSPATAYSPARSWRVAGHAMFTPLGTKVPLTLEP